MKITINLEGTHGVTKDEIQRTIDAIERAARREPAQAADMMLLSDAAWIFKAIQNEVPR